MKSFEEVKEKLASFTFEEDFDLLVAIANGGLIPAAILNQRLNIEIRLLRINWRDTKQKPIYDKPKLIVPIDFEFKNRRILLVEDRVKTGASLRYAKELLEKDAALVKTFAVNGTADYSLYDEACFKFPWLI
ncbi:MAG TPA: phosphoribosyltransferase family protein [Niabella sp.]|nr:phosphoribosyltransferase domain-containing protein [Chitinophagaceae bacterium]HRN48236.1 phosphoribosyltransferase family protein [Niabella sp.]HRO84633.1 phosphoribosyltransferase family protein [Niabella sp.]HUN03155.1 phosphoribosyltransferase family protein [Niabella sp.]